MEQIAFTMQLKSGVTDEYRARHDTIWPELVSLLRDAGVHDYSIFHDTHDDRLFAVLRRSDDHRMDALPLEPVMQRWWAAMADLMETYDDNEPVTVPLERLFHLP